MNALLRYDRAIVSDTPGTTRDTLEEQVDIDGIAFIVVDTAGIRGAADSVESEGINRARKALFEADVALLVLDCARGLEESDYAVANLIIEHGLPALAALNKSDLPQQLSDEITVAMGLDCSVVQTCAINDHGVEPLRVGLSDLVNTDNIQAGDFPLVTNERHREALRTAEYHLGASKKAVVDGLPADFISIGLHGAVRILGEITGDDASEDLLAAIFTKFCIGK